jgi:hypothetical protein
MRPPWLRALTGCLQMIVRSEDDIEVEAGEVALGEVRARAFAELARAYDLDHLLSLAWLSLADLAVWPQLPVQEAAALAQFLEIGGTYRPALSIGQTSTPSQEALQGVTKLLTLIERIRSLGANPMSASPVDLAPLRVAINRIAQLSGSPVAYWEKWLRRIVPSAARLPSPEARALAIASLRSTFAVPDRWAYVAELVDQPIAPDGPKEVRVGAFAPGRGGREIAVLGTFSKQDPVQRKIESTFSPRIAVDPYRMGYLFHSTYMTDLLDDAKTGYYDAVTCTNIATGEVWSYQRF